MHQVSMLLRIDLLRIAPDSFAPDFQCWYFCESSCLFYLSFNFDFYVSKIMHL